MAEICSTPMCEAGKAAVDEMLSVFHQLEPAVGQDFSITVNAIKEAFDANFHWYDPYIPFNSACCTIRDIGVQAEGVTNRMLAAVNQGPLPGTATPAAPGQLPSVGELGVSVGVGIAIVLALLVFSSRR